MAFNSRQFEELYGYIEVSISAAVSPGAVGNGAVVGVSAACTLAGTTTPATFALGDILDVIAPASAALNGLVVTAGPTATAGTCFITFYNGTGGSITPTASTVYKIVARRVRPDISF